MRDELAATKKAPENDPVMVDVDDAAMRAALKNFRSSVHAWSDAAYVRPRTVALSQQGFAWRRVVGWVLSLAISAGLVGTAVYQRHLTGELAYQQQQREQQKLLAEKHARETEDLLAKVDSDVSREVPSAMEPLAQLMVDSGN